MSETGDVFALMYHEVTDDPAGTGLQRPGARPYTISCGAFREHLHRIAASGLTPERVDTVAPRHNGRRLMLTFDDGGLSARDVAERLHARGWPAHFFIVTAWIGRRRFLDAAAIREIRSLGHLVGSHSHTHPDIFRGLSRARMLAEWRASRDTLGDVLGEPCGAASVPGGDSSRIVFETAAEAGYRFLFTSEPWRHPRQAGTCRVFGRLTVKRHMSAARIAGYLAGNGWGWALLQRRAKDVLRRGLGPLYRDYVRHTTRPWRGSPA
jgi:peptidoglycan/xylan/chitin deacetylase (PgdA/CDA1 family)